jgi:hypothetical protein
MDQIQLALEHIYNMQVHDGDTFERCITSFEALILCPPLSLCQASFLAENIICVVRKRQHLLSFPRWRHCLGSLSQVVVVDVCLFSGCDERLRTWSILTQFGSYTTYWSLSISRMFRCKMLDASDFKIFYLLDEWCEIFLMHEYKASLKQWHRRRLIFLAFFLTLCAFLVCCVSQFENWNLRTFVTFWL